MKVLFLLFLVFITYSHSINIQKVLIGDSLTYLTASKDEEYFYFSIDRYSYHNYLYLFLLVDDYNINQINYCRTNTYPSQSSIDSCSFNSFSSDYSESQKKSSSTSFYYKVPISSGYSYIIIKYLGSNNYGTIKASASYTHFIRSITLGSSSNTEITKLVDSNNYFYTYIGYPNSDYLYFYIKDQNYLLEEPIYYCFTYSDPQDYSPIRYCSFSSLYMYQKNPDSEYHYLYRVNIRYYNGYNLLVKYSVSSPNGWLYVKIRTSQPLSTVAIVFIVIGSLAFVGIIIGLIVYCCKKRASRNIAYVPTQQAVMDSTPIFPSMESNNVIQPINS